MSARMSAVRLVIEVKAALGAVRRRRADVYVDCAGGWRYPSYLLPALRRCGDLLLEVPKRDAVLAWSADGFRNFVVRTRVVRDGRPATAPVVIARDPRAIRGDFRSRVTVSVDWFSPEARAAGLVMPYFVHPALRRVADELPEPGAGPRPIRIGFAGTMNEESYREGFAFPLLTRSDVLGEVLRRFERELRVVRSRAELEGGPETRIVLVVVNDDRDTTSKHLLRGRDYLAFLGRCSFALTPPGYRMPLCHNLVEAMSVGAIPILNYAEWLHPPLRDGVDCLAFSTADELSAAVSRALAMADEELESLRAGARAYYAEHLALEPFARRLCGVLDRSPTIVVNAERETAALWRERQAGAVGSMPR